MQSIKSGPKVKKCNNNKISKYVNEFQCNSCVWLVSDKTGLKAFEPMENQMLNFKALLLDLLDTCSFICEASTRRQRSDLFGFQVKLPPVTQSLTSQTRRQSRYVPSQRTQQSSLLACSPPISL